MFVHLGSCSVNDEDHNEHMIIIKVSRRYDYNNKNYSSYFEPMKVRPLSGNSNKLVIEPILSEKEMPNKYGFFNFEDALSAAYSMLHEDLRSFDSGDLSEITAIMNVGDFLDSDHPKAI